MVIISNERLQDHEMKTYTTCHGSVSSMSDL